MFFFCVTVSFSGADWIGHDWTQPELAPLFCPGFEDVAWK